MEDKFHLTLTQNEKNYLLKRLNLNLNNLESASENAILESIISKIKSIDEVLLYIDGAAMPERQGAGIGGVCYKNKEKLFSFSKFIGNKTNNEAEYFALIQGLNQALEINLKVITIYSDSQLIVNQINGNYQVKNERMKVCYQEAMNVLSNFTRWTITHIPREKNKEADFLSKQGLQI